MATAGLDHGMLWTDLEGCELNGRWKLNRLVRPEGRTAWFEATGPDGKPAMLSITETLNDEEDLLERLWAVGQIRHPNVVAIREAAVAHVDETPLVIAVMEPTEENLGDVLRERPLNAAEAREVLDALVAGLGAIHGRGLVHGRVEAGSVLAMGETIKLRSDCVHLANTVAITAAEDIRNAGRVVTQAMTRRLPSGENDAVLQLLPEPMARAVRRALSGTASATEVAALAGTRLEVISERRDDLRIDPVSRTAPARAAVPDVAIPKPQAPVPAKNVVEGTLPADRDLPRGELAEGVRAASKASPAKRVLPMRPADVHPETLPLFEEEIATLPPSTRLAEDDEPEWGRWPTAPYIIVSAVALILVTVFTLYGILHRKAATPKAPATPTVVVERPAAPAKAVAAPARSAKAAAIAPAGEGWRVIAYTYIRREDAEKKSSELAKQYPDLRPAAFSPRAGRWLVSLGGVMSRSDAIALRAKALSLGFPGDTYARNYK